MVTVEGVVATVVVVVAAISAVVAAAISAVVAAAISLVAVAISLVVAVVVIHFGMSQRPFWKSSRSAPWLEAALRLVLPGLEPSVLWPAPGPGA